MKKSPKKDGKKKGKKAVEEESEELTDEDVPEIPSETADETESQETEDEEPKKEKKKDKKAKKGEKLTEDSDEEELKDTVETEENKSEEVGDKIPEEKKNNATNNITVEITDAAPAVINETVLENPELANNEAVIPLNTTAVNTTSNVISDVFANNNTGLNETAPVDPNILAIDKKLNETVEVIQDFDAANAEPKKDNEIAQIGESPKEEVEFGQENQANMEATQVDTGTVYEKVDEDKNGSNILVQGENAEEGTEQHELSQSGSAKSNLSAVLLATFCMVLFVGLF